MKLFYYKWTPSSGMKLIPFVLLFSVCAIYVLLQRHLVVEFVLKRNMASRTVVDAVLSTESNLSVFTNEETWQQMHNYQVILLKSVAFIDQRNSHSTPVLRLLVYKNHNLKHTGACLVKHSVDEPFSEIGGHFTLINLVSPKCPGGCAWRYEAYYFDCELKNSVVASVKLKLIYGHPNVTTEISQPINNVHKSEPVTNPEHEVAVCAKALYKYSVWFRLILFVEVYQHLGVSLFMFYNHSTTEDTDRLLKYYMNRKKVELISWPSIPVKDTNLEYFKKFEGLSKYGQILAHNHCLLSLIGRARYVILVDIDELIIPSSWNEEDTLKNSIPRLLKVKTGNKEKIGGFQVRSAYVNMSFPQYGSISAISAEHLQLPKIFEKFQHYDIQKPGQRCKMILKPESTDKMTVHRPFYYLDSFHEEIIGPEDALIYHLRDKKLPGKIIDKFVNPFVPMKASVTEALKSVIKTIQMKPVL